MKRVIPINGLFIWPPFISGDEQVAGKVKKLALAPAGDGFYRKLLQARENSGNRDFRECAKPYRKKPDDHDEIQELADPPGAAAKVHW